tara:strand:+ start:5 stop:328 length:324 start_codon:yes stop_codon:yes gene_type:complete
MLSSLADGNKVLMEGFGILVLCLLGLVALIFVILAIEDENRRNPSWKSDTPDPYYESEEYKRFCEERKRNYGRVPSQEDKNKTYKGKRGGKYTKDKTKDGRPYRRYF